MYKNSIDQNMANYTSIEYKQDDLLLFILKYKTNDILIFSDLLYSYYGAIFLLMGIILLSAMLGSIILALSTIENTDSLGKKKHAYEKPS